MKQTSTQSFGFAQAGDVFARPARPPKKRAPRQALNEAGDAFAGPRASRSKNSPQDRPREAGSVFARQLNKPAPPIFKASFD